MALTGEVTERKCAPEFLDLIESEYTFLVVMTRSIVEQRKEVGHV